MSIGLAPQARSLGMRRAVLRAALPLIVTVYATESRQVKLKVVPVLLVRYAHSHLHQEKVEWGRNMALGKGLSDVEAELQVS